MSRRERWEKTHLANIDGRAIKEWRYCPQCHRTTRFYLLDGIWKCHRAVMNLMVVQGVTEEVHTKLHA